MRTRAGEVLVGPTIRSRISPGLRYGLPIIAVLCAPIAGSILQRHFQVYDGPGVVLLLLAGAVVVYLLGALLGVVTLAGTRSAVIFDERDGTISQQRGFRRRSAPRPLSEIHYAVGDAEKNSVALIGFREGEQWVIDHIAWDDASFDGLRVLQRAVDLPVAPARHELAAQALHARVLSTHQQLAERFGMTWQTEYEERETFLSAFDEHRRALAARSRGAAPASQPTEQS